MRVHELKTDPKYYERVLLGQKRFELRLNDRGYQLGDVLILREFDRHRDKYSGRVLTVKVKFVTDYPRALRKGFVALSLSAPRVTTYEEALNLGKPREICRYCCHPSCNLLFGNCVK